MTTGIQLAFGEASDPGLDPNKRVNEDAAGNLRTQHGHLFVVCDGMGGHAGGKQASALALRTVFETFQQASAAEKPRALLARAIVEAARRVYRMGGPAGNKQRPGSTCVAMLFGQSQIEVAHVGDSRAYAFRGDRVVQLTRDHSLVREMVDQGMLSPQEAIGHPQANKITRALGMLPEAEVELRSDAMEIFDGDIFLLATDGLTDMVRDRDILVTVKSYLESGDENEACRELVALANRRGGHDNTTVQVIRVQAPGLGRPITKLQAPRTATQSPQGATHPAPGPTRVQVPLAANPPANDSVEGPDDLSVTEPGRPASSHVQQPTTQIQRPTAPFQGRAPGGHEAHLAPPPEALLGTPLPNRNETLENQVARLRAAVIVLATLLTVSLGVLAWALLSP